MAVAVRILELLFIVCRNAPRTIYARCTWRYKYQVTVCTIYKKIKEVHLKSESLLPLIQWLDKRSTESNMAFVWQLIFNVEILLLLFV